MFEKDYDQSALPKGVYKFSDEVTLKEILSILRGDTPLEPWHLKDESLGMIPARPEYDLGTVEKFAISNRDYIDHVGEQLDGVAERVHVIESRPEVPKTLQSRLKRLGIACGIAVVLSACAFGLTFKNPDALLAEPVKVAPVEAKVEIPFWFKDEVHEMTSNSVSFLPTYWRVEMQKANPEELAVYKNYLIDLPRGTEWLPDAKRRLAAVLSIINEQLEPRRNAIHQADLQRD